MAIGGVSDVCCLLQRIIALADAMKCCAALRPGGGGGGGRLLLLQYSIVLSFFCAVLEAAECSWVVSIPFRFVSFRFVPFRSTPFQRRGERKFSPVQSSPVQFSSSSQVVEKRYCSISSATPKKKINSIWFQLAAEDKSQTSASMQSLVYLHDMANGKWHMAYCMWHMAYSRA